MDKIVRYYEAGAERDRLAAGAGRLERERTEQIIRETLPPPPLVVVDVGGGPGAYASWLLSLGYEVHLIDPVALHVEQARVRLGDVDTSTAHRWSVAVGDARKLEQSSQSADAVLLLGPLYHLTERDCRMAALKEAHRVLRPGGLLYAAAISRFASVLDGIARNLLDDPEFERIVDRDLSEGQHRNETGCADYFTEAFFHRPDQLREEVESGGFTLVRLAGLEGPAWLLPDIEDRFADAARRRRWLKMLQRIETEPSLIGGSAHMLAVGRKNDAPLC